MEVDYEYVLNELNHTNIAQLRWGSYVSENSKFEVEWRYLTQASREKALYFNCYPNTDWHGNQGEYLNSRLNLAVNQYLTKHDIAIPISK